MLNQKEGHFQLAPVSSWHVKWCTTKRPKSRHEMKRTSDYRILKRMYQGKGGGGQFQSKKKFNLPHLQKVIIKCSLLFFLFFFSFKGSKKFQSIVKIREVPRQTIWNSRIVYTCTSEFKTKHKSVVKKNFNNVHVHFTVEGSHMELHDFILHSSNEIRLQKFILHTSCCL